MRGNTDFVRLLLDKDWNGDLDLKRFLTISRLYDLYDITVSKRNCLTEDSSYFFLNLDLFYEVLDKQAIAY